MSNNPATDATLITVAPTGAEADKTAVPALPVTRGRPVTGNLELVERAATLAGLAQRPPMRPDQARAMLGVE
jgi:uncharacterized protein (DUF849 family)